MKKQLRSFTAEQKMQILRDSENMTVAAVCRKYEITHSLYYRWKSQFDAHGIEGLQGKRLPQKDPRMKELERENERLKKIITRQLLELEIKEEMLKKTQHLKR